MEIIHKIKSKNKKITKFCIKLKDNSIIETVLFKSPRFLTACVSTQVGCPIGCIFCESGKSFKRNLSEEEILKQVDLMQKNTPQKIEYVKFFGIGEPLLNFDNIIKAIKTLSIKSPNMKFAISTIGLTKEINKLSNTNLNIDLFISLHGTTNKQRKFLIPELNENNLSELLKQVEKYRLSQKVPKKIQITYLLFKDFNDSKNDLRRLATYFKEGYKVILKRMCSVRSQRVCPSNKKKFDEFKKYLDKKHIECHISYSKGKDIKAGCGQLKAKFENDQNNKF